MVKVLATIKQLLAPTKVKYQTYNIVGSFVAVSADSNYVIFRVDKNDKFYQQCKQSQQVCDSHNHPKQFLFMIRPVGDGYSVVKVNQQYNLIIGYCATNNLYSLIKIN